MNIVEKLSGKRILIFGYGREGKSTEQFLKTHCSPASVEIYEGDRNAIIEENYDYIIKSPGIPAFDLSEKYTSQTELFLEQFRDQTVGITGTKGKSTTSSLLYHSLINCGKKAVLVGNIGLPCLDYYDTIDQDTVVVYELSCHQLSSVRVSPHVGVFLNFYEEHLDYYKTIDRYFEAKSHVTTFQSERDCFYKGDQVPEICTRAKTETVLRNDPEAETYDLQIPGDHNQYNARFVYRITTEVFQLKPENVKKAMSTFAGLPHRLQYIGMVNGVRFYDDSISTIPSATIAALQSVPEAKTVIVGGMDRGIDYSLLKDFMKNHGEYTFVLAYETGKRIEKELINTYGICSNVHCVGDLSEAVILAKELTESGKACILSPAAASYGYFKNFEERGDVFKQLVFS